MLDQELMTQYTRIKNVFDLLPQNQFQNLNVLRAEAIKKRASAETQRAWRSDWKVWLGFCNSGCLEFDHYRYLEPNDKRRLPLPADPRLIQDFITFYSPATLSKKGKESSDTLSPKAHKFYSVATLNRILSTIAKAHELKSYELPHDQLEGFVPNPVKDPIVTATLSSCSRYRKKQKQARPIQWKDVAEFLSIEIPPEAKLPNTPDNKDIKSDLSSQLKTEAHWLRARALLTIAYNSMARREELVSVQLEHIEYSNDNASAALYLPITKGDKDDYRHLSNYAVEELRRWIDISEIKTGSVFCKIQSNGKVCLRSKRRGQFLEYGKALSSSEVNKIFKACMNSIGRPDDIVKGVSGHSCRVGAAIDLQEYGASGPQIQDAGGWTSPTMPNRYTRSAKTHSNAMANLSKQQKK